MQEKDNPMIINLKQKKDLESVITHLINQLQNYPQQKLLSPQLILVNLPRFETQLQIQSSEWNKTSDQAIMFQYQLSLTFSYFSFNNLTYLIFHQAQLNNCEFVSFMNLPNLKAIWFGRSAIQNFKPFTKAHLPSLTFIHSHRMISSKLQLERSNLPTAERFIFQYNLQDPKITFDLSFLVKTGSKEKLLIKFPIIMRKNGESTTYMLSYKQKNQIVDYKYG